MLDTSELEYTYSMIYRQWIEDHGLQQTDGGGMLCDFCELPSTDGNLYNVPGEDGREFLLCPTCFSRVYSKLGSTNSRLM